MLNNDTYKKNYPPVIGEYAYFECKSNTYSFTSFDNYYWLVNTNEYGNCAASWSNPRNDIIESFLSCNGKILKIEKLINNEYIKLYNYHNYVKKN